MKFNRAIGCLLGNALLVTAQVDLGTAASFGALAPAGITNTGDTVIQGDIGTTGTSVTGFPPGIYTGSLYVADGVAAQAQADSTAAFIQGQLLIPTTNYGALAELSGLVLGPGVYNFDSAVGLTDTLTLSGAGTYVFQIGSSLTTASNSVVALTNGANACDVYWIVSSAATIGTNSDFAGNILAGTQITLNTGASVAGGLYAGSQVTLDDNEVSSCGGATPPGSSTTTDVSATSTTAGPSDTTTVSVPDVTITISVPDTTTTVPTSVTASTTTVSSTTAVTTGPITTSKTSSTSSKWTTSTTKKSTTTKITTTKITTTTKKTTSTTKKSTTQKTSTTSKKLTTTTKKTTTTTKKPSTTTKKTTSKATTTTKIWYPAPTY